MHTRIMESTTHYQKIGTGVNVVLLHGWGCSWEIWSPIIRDLSESFTLVLPDLPGFGKSLPAPKIWDSYQYAEWLKEFIQHTIPGKKYILLGHSFGGKIASLYAAKHNHPNLSQLIILDASGLPEPLPKHKQLQQGVIAHVPRTIKELIPFRLKQRIFKTLNASDDYLHATPYQKKSVAKNTI